MSRLVPFLSVPYLDFRFSESWSGLPFPSHTGRNLRSVGSAPETEMEERESRSRKKRVVTNGYRLSY